MAVCSSNSTRSTALIILFLIAIAWISLIPHDTSAAPVPVSSLGDVDLSANVPLYVLNPVDEERYLWEDAINADTKDQPFRYGAEVIVGLSLFRDGSLDILSNGDELWRIQIVSPGAKSLSFQLSPFYLIRGALLFIYTPDKSYILDPLTDQNNTGKDEFWTAAVPFDEAVLELYLPSGSKPGTQVEIATAVHAYRDSVLTLIMSSFEEPDLKASGTCNVDVECERAQWGNEIRSVAHYTFGMYMCTGTLLNNISEDCTPYFWTANHCVSSNSNAGKVVAYWNYERSECGGGTGPYNLTTSGSSLIWTSSTSDATLLEFTSSPNPAYNTHMAGFSAATTAPTASTCIHHPSGDYKKISHENATLTITSYLGTSSPGDATHWRVIDWDSGTTEGGSSGSGLWNNANRRIVGQLHGGYAACGNDSSDWYGRFSVSWSNGVSAYLDPGNTGLNYVDGKDMSSCGGCTPPSAPTGLSVTDACDTIDLAWTAVAAADGYIVLRKIGTCGGTYITLGTVTGTTYIDSTAVAGTQYSYIVRAYIGTTSCVSGDSNCVTATVLSSPTAPPSPTVTDACTGLMVSWSSVSGATSYHVWRRDRGCGTNGWTDLTPSGVTGINYTDTTAASGSTYGYYIDARNSCGTVGDKANCATGTHSLTPPGVPIITGISDESSCAQSGIRITFTGGEGATSHDLVRNGTVVVTGYTTGTLYNPGGTTSYLYIVRAVNACGSADSSSQTFADANNTPGSPSITGITDNDACLQDGIRITYAAGSDASSHDLYDNGSLAVSGYVSNTLYNPGDTLSHTYIVRAINGTCYTNSAGQAFTDANSSPGVPIITGITDNDACLQNGIRISYTAGSGATSHDLYRDASLVVTGYASNALYNPGDSTSHVYHIRAINGCGGTNSTNQAATDSSNAPGTPLITGITDVNDCAQSGIRVVYTGGSGATSHDLYRDGGLVVTGYASNTIFNPGDTSSHTYVVRALMGGCYTDSSGQDFTDGNNSTTPTISGPESNTCPSVSVTLSTESGMSNYQWYLNGSPLSGAIAYEFSAEISGNYTVSYLNLSGCTGISAVKTVTIIPCVPNIVYQGHEPLLEVSGDGDMVMEAGEKWLIQVTVTNIGQTDAVNVLGSLAGEGLSVCNNPASFGDIAPGGTGTFIFEFVPEPAFWYGTFPCGSTLGLDVVTKSSDGGTYTYDDDIDFLTGTVGMAEGTREIFSDDFADLNNWTQSPADSTALQTAVHCSDHSESYARINGGNASLAIARSTVGFTNIHVEFDALTTAMDAGEYLILEWFDGSVWTQAWSGQPTTWSCSVNIGPLPVIAEDNASFQIRFLNNASKGNEYGSVDKVIISGTGPAQCDIGTASCNGTPPPETSPGDTLANSLAWSDAQTLVWSVNDAAVSGYHVYRGTLADLPMLLDEQVDSCLRATTADETAITLTSVSDDPSSVEGHLYWYLVTGLNPAGEGTAGSATSGPRTLNWASTCPATFLPRQQ